MYVVRLSSHAAVSALFSAVVFIGLSAITFTVSSLFSLNTSFNTYFRIWLVIAGILAPFLLMTGIPKGTVVADTKDYPRVLKNLIMYVVVPLIVSYTLVLYVYFAKILITWEWPIGLVGHLVLWYSMVSVALLFFVWPVTSENRWADAFSRYFPRAVIPLLLMMFASVGIRIHHYGVTENRYYVLVFGLWVFGAMLYLILTKARRSLVLPLSLAVVVLLAVFGPWSSFSVSKCSQNRRLENLLTKYGMLQGNTIVPASLDVSLSDRREIAEILFYFERNHELSDVRVLPEDFEMAEFQTVFGFDYADHTLTDSQRNMQYEAQVQSLDVSGYRYLFDYARDTSGGAPVCSLREGNVTVTYNQENRKIEVRLDGNLEWEESLLEYINSLQLESKESGRWMEFSPEDMVIYAETARLRIKVVITRVLGTVAPDGSRSVGLLWFYLLVGEK